jgi:lipoate-protein ligase B
MEEAICYRKSVPRKLLLRNCGIMPYRQALQMQLELCAQRLDGQIPNTILVVEHPPVITMGARKTENKLLVSAGLLGEKGIELVQIRRGGGCTAHNPGQIVVYPIIKLKSLNIGVNDYIRQLEAIGVELLESFSVKSSRRKGFPGLWVGPRKIGSIGVQVKRWITLHGMAINFNNDLSIFENIVPCGLDGVFITSVKNETGSENPMDAVKKKMMELCVKYFSSRELAVYEA